MNFPSHVRFMHVANGTSTTGGIEAAGIPGERSIWADPLYEGPVPAGLSDEELLGVRARFLAGPGESAVEPVNDMRRWREVIAAHDSYDELVLWFEHDLFDQLNLIQLLSWIRSCLPAEKIVSLICVGSFPGRPRFKGLGELLPTELASLFDTRRPIRDAEYVLAERAWQAFREPTPEALDNLRRADTTALPYLARAVERFLQEYPSTLDGLSRSERRLLRLAEHAPIAVSAAFPRMHDEEQAYYVTDLSLAGLVSTLSRTSPPLLAIDDDAGAQRHASADDADADSPAILDDPRVDAAALRGTVSVTEAGRQVLSGHRDRVACGLDRWLGGVHLQSGADVWRWDDEQRRVRR